MKIYKCKHCKGPVTKNRMVKKYSGDYAKPRSDKTVFCSSECLIEYENARPMVAWKGEYDSEEERLAIEALNNNRNFF